MDVAVRKKGPDGPFKSYSMLNLNVEYRYKLFDFQGFYKILFSSNYTLKYNENRPYI